MEKSWDRLVARIAIESTCDAIVARAEMRQTHTSSHMEAKTELRLLCETVEANVASRRTQTAHARNVALALAGINGEHECPVRGCVQCDTLTFTRKVG